MEIDENYVKTCLKHHKEFQQSYNNSRRNIMEQISYLADAEMSVVLPGKNQDSLGVIFSRNLDGMLLNVQKKERLKIDEKRKKYLMQLEELQESEEMLTRVLGTYFATAIYFPQHFQIVQNGYYISSMTWRDMMEKHKKSYKHLRAAVDDLCALIADTVNINPEQLTADTFQQVNPKRYDQMVAREQSEKQDKPKEDKEDDYRN